MNAHNQNPSGPEEIALSRGNLSFPPPNQLEATTQPPLTSSTNKLFPAAIDYMKRWYEAAIGLLEKSPTWEVYQGLIRDLRDEAHTLTVHPLFQSRSISDLLGKKGDLAKSLSSRIAQIVGVDQRMVESQLKSEFVAQLNRTGWTSEEHWLDAEVGSDHLSLFNTSVPLNSEFAKISRFSPFTSMGISGRSSGSLKTELCDESLVTQVPNGWYTSLRNNEGSVLFDGFRTATLVNYGELNPERRHRATQESALQLLRAIAHKHLSALSDVEREEITLGHKPLSLKIASFDLQTWVAKVDVPNKFDIERLTIEEQRLAMHDLIGRSALLVEHVDPDGKTNTIQIEVDTEVLSFNFPVHEKSFMDGIGWDGEVAQRNQEAVMHLLDRTAEKLRELTQSKDPVDHQKTGRKILHLKKEVEDILELQAYKDADFDPYKMNSRLLNLARLIGYELVLAGFYFRCILFASNFGVISICPEIS